MNPTQDSRVRPHLQSIQMLPGGEYVCAAFQCPCPSHTSNSPFDRPHGLSRRAPSISLGSSPVFWELIEHLFPRNSMQPLAHSPGLEPSCDLAGLDLGVDRHQVAEDHPETTDCAHWFPRLFDSGTLLPIAPWSKDTIRRLASCWNNFHILVSQKLALASTVFTPA